MDLLKAALDFRASHITAKTTNVYRMVDGEADACPNLYIDNYADNWLIQSSGDFPEELLQVSGWRSIYYKKLEKGDKKSPQWMAGEKLPEFFEVFEGPSKYWVSFDHGYSQGFFIDQRDNRELMARLSKNKKMLNLFSYTSSFSLRAAFEGAHTVSVDLSSPSLEWAKRNFLLNKIDLENHLFWRGDARDYLKRAKKSGEFFDSVVIDPPSFSRDKKSGTFQIEKEFQSLVESAFEVLNSKGSIFFSCNLQKQDLSFFEKPLKKIAQKNSYKCEVKPLTWDFRRKSQLKAFLFTPIL
ncbi:MAG: class I SAM-dependent rRNA methyltransferase [Proteobacteria bacterium]|nr:class I SAM-dependent rRNA methyltransferase [Pseudomonadota bacterium]